MNYKLLPPRPDINDAMSILNIPNSPSGFKQILQHVAYDGLGLFIPVVKDIIKTTDDRIIKKEILGMDVIQIDSSRINPNTSWEENQVERLVGFCKVGKCSVLSEDNQGQDYYLRVDSVVNDGLEHYMLDFVFDFSEDLREKLLKKFPTIKEIGDDEDLLAERERLGEYVDSYKIGHLIPNLNSAYFDRQELIEFAESFNDVGVIKNSQINESNVYLNAQDENYAIELDIAIQAYKAVIIEGWTDNVKRNGYSDYLKAWVKSSYPNGSEAFINRISAVANPKKEIPSSK